jgi:acyl dehydratase
MVDASAIGRAFAPTHARVEPGRLRYFLNTLGDANPIYRDHAAAKAAGFAATPIPPTYLVCLEMMDADDPFAMLDALDIDLRRVLHGEQKFVYHAPVVVGDELTLQSTVTGVTQKKGGAMTLIDVATRIVNQRGQHVADATRVVVIRNPEVSV